VKSYRILSIVGPVLDNNDGLTIGSAGLARRESLGCKFILLRVSRDDILASRVENLENISQP